MAKWQYSELRHIAGGTATMFSKAKTEELVDFGVYGDPSSNRQYNIDQLGKVIAWLGNDGWELVGVTNTFLKLTDSVMDLHTSWYFKKQIS